MKKFIYIFFLFAFFVVNSTNAQSNRKNWRLANEAFEANNYYDALDYFIEYIKEKDPDNETKLKLGICYFYTNNVQDGIPFLKEVSEEKSDYKKSAIFYLGRAYHSTLDFVSAIKYYKDYIRITKGNNKQLSRSITNEIKRCSVGIKLSGLSQIAYVENLGGLVNDLGDDCSPLFSFNRKGRIYFSSQRRGSIGGLRDIDGFEDIENGQNDYDIYFTDIKNSSWSIAKRMPDFVNTVRNDILLDFTSNGRVMEIFRGLNNYSGVIALDTFKKDRKKSLKYYYFESPVKPENGDNSIFFYNDTTLLFSSNREGGYGGKDLYLTIKKGNQWTIPQNLGSKINTAFDEESPFLANDGKTLFFSSNNIQSIGGLDVFYAEFDAETNTFLKPKNIGLPINSYADDVGFRLDNAGMQGLFASSRKDGYGKRDIYLSYFKSKIINAQKKYYPLILGLLEKDTLVLAEADKSKITKLEIDPLYYTEDEDILSLKNTRILDKMIPVLEKFPYIDLILEVYSDDVDALNKFNLFFTSKKGEEIRDYLISKSIDPNRISIKGMGKNYPIALNYLNNKPYKFGKRMNQRIEIIINTHNEKFLAINYSEPKIPENIKLQSRYLLKKNLKGLTFRIEIANIEKMFQGEELENYDDPIAEILPNEGSCHYSVGLSRNFMAIKILYKGIYKNNKSAKIIPFWDGKRTTLERIIQFAEKDKQAKAYLAFLKKDQ